MSEWNIIEPPVLTNEERDAIFDSPEWRAEVARAARAMEEE